MRKKYVRGILSLCFLHIFFSHLVAQLPPVISQLILLQGLVSVSGPRVKETISTCPKVSMISFMPRHHHTSKAFVPTGCDCILHWELLLGGVSTPGGWFLGFSSCIKIRSTQMLLSTQKGSPQKLKLLLLQMVKADSLVGRLL